MAAFAAFGSRVLPTISQCDFHYRSARKDFDMDAKIDGMKTKPIPAPARAALQLGVRQRYAVATETKPRSTVRV